MIKRVLVDTGASTNILYSRTWDKLNSPQQLTPSATPLVAFGGGEFIPVGTAVLPLTLGYGRHATTKEVPFTIVNAPGAYNAILGRSALNAFKAVASTYHLKLKFPTQEGITAIRGDQSSAQQCYLAALKGKDTLYLNKGKQPRPQLHPEDAILALKEAAAEAQGHPLPLPIESDLSDPRDEVPESRVSPTEELISYPLSDDPQRTVQMGADLPEELRDRMLEVIRANAHVFAWTPADMPGIEPTTAQHRLAVNPDVKPIKQRKRHFAPPRNQAIAEEVAKLLQAGFIRPVDFPEWLANVVLVKKANGKWRLCIDFTDLNTACPKDSYPLPRIDQLVDATSGYALLSFLDAYSGYNQIPMYPPDEEKTSFITNQGTFCYKVMPFGLKNAGATYQRMVDKVFKLQQGRNIEAYVDDLLVKSKSMEDHIRDLEETFATLHKHQMKLNASKCAFGVKSGKFLGFMVTNRGIEANPDKIQAVLDMQPPTCLREVQKLAGRVAALGRFLSKSAEKCLPFFKLLQRSTSFEWTEECQKAFNDLKTALASPPLLTRPQPGDSLYLYLGVSDAAVSAVITREEASQHRPVYYISHALHGPETRYSRAEKVALALYIASRRLRPYFQAHTVTVLSDLPIRSILYRPDTSGRLIKWSVSLSEYDILYKPRPAIKAQVLADFFVECSCPNDGILSEQLWELYVDGSAHKDGQGAGLHLVSPEGDHFCHALKFQFPTTNNEAEYEALLLGLDLALSYGIRHLKVFSDSQLITSQVSGTYEAEEPNLKLYLSKVHQLFPKFTTCQLHHTPRELNKTADALSKLASLSPGSPDTTVRLQTVETSRLTGAEAVFVITSDPNWQTPLRQFYLTGELPADTNARRRLQRQLPKYHLVGDILYRRGYTLPDLKCAAPAEARYILDEIHSGACGTHQGARTLAHKALRQGYYWPTMVRDAERLVRHCDLCQRHAAIPRQPPTELSPICSPVPFAQWGMDILGPFKPSSKQNTYIIVAIDYFTKWVEAEALSRITEEACTKFFWKNIICRFGLPRAVVTDNGKQFDCENFRNFCAEYGIQHKLTSVAYPQSNGLAESANKNILNGIRMKVKDAEVADPKKWADVLPEILWTDRTTVKQATGHSPYQLTFGSECVLPVELAAFSTRLRQFNEDTNSGHILANLDLLDELREDARRTTVAYQDRVTKYFNKKVRPRRFQVGSLVMRLRKVSEGKKGKLDSNWEGPYIVHAVHNNGAYEIKTLDGEVFPHTWNAQNLRQYYQ